MFDDVQDAVEDFGAVLLLAEKLKAIGWDETFAHIYASYALVINRKTSSGFKEIAAQVFQSFNSDLVGGTCGNLAGIGNFKHEYNGALVERMVGEAIMLDRGTQGEITELGKYLPSIGTLNVRYTGSAGEIANTQPLYAGFQLDGMVDMISDARNSQEGWEDSVLLRYFDPKTSNPAKIAHYADYLMSTGKFPRDPMMAAHILSGSKFQRTYESGKVDGGYPVVISRN